MYLHLGNASAVKKSDIIGVFDMDNTTISKQGRKFLTIAEKNNRIVYTSEDLPKSYIIANTGNKTTVYVSSISSATLKKRAGLSKITIVD